MIQPMRRKPVQMCKGVGAARWRDLSAGARNAAPCIITGRTVVPKVHPQRLRVDPVHKVSIFPRAIGTPGHTLTRPAGERTGQLPERETVKPADIAFLRPHEHLAA